MENKKTDREILESLDRRVKNIERGQTVQVVFIVLAFVGIVTVADLMKKVKQKIN